jgi:hypothetical protein
MAKQKKAPSMLNVVAEARASVAAANLKAALEAATPHLGYTGCAEVLADFIHTKAVNHGLQMGKTIARVQKKQRKSKQPTAVAA